MKLLRSSTCESYGDLSSPWVVPNPTCGLSPLIYGPIIGHLHEFTEPCWVIQVTESSRGCGVVA